MADAKTEKQKVKEITDKLEEGLKEFFESEKYKIYLSTMSKFHNYSFNNTLLIAMQKPEATLVGGGSNYNAGSGGSGNNITYHHLWRHSKRQYRVHRCLTTTRRWRNYQ